MADYKQVFNGIHLPVQKEKLRDVFAFGVMLVTELNRNTKVHIADDAESKARYCYELADAMIEQRSKNAF